MKKYIKIIALSMVGSVGVLTSCFEEQNVSPIVSPDNNAVITMTRVDDNAGTNSVSEGDTIVYEITSSKMLEAAIDFSTTVLDGAGVDDHDYEVIGGVLTPYSTSTIMQIVVLEDDFPETSESLKLELSAYNVVQSYNLNPSSTPGNIDVEVENKNMEGVVTIALSWPDPDHVVDLDMYIFSADIDDDWGGGGAATGSNPEISTALWPSDPNGTYYVGIDPYALPAGATDYKFSIGYEDGSVEFFEGNFNKADEDSYEVDNGAYRLLEIVLLDGNVTVTKVAP